MKEDTVFCYSGLDWIYNHEVSMEECLKDFKKDDCEVIKIKQCHSCPKNAVCDKGKMVNMLYYLN